MYFRINLFSIRMVVVAHTAVGVDPAYLCQECFVRVYPSDPPLNHVFKYSAFDYVPGE